MKKPALKIDGPLQVEVLKNEDTGESVQEPYYLPAGSDPEKAMDRYLQRIKDDYYPTSCRENGGDGDYQFVCNSSGGTLR